MFESCTRNFSSLRNPHSRVPKFVFGVRKQPYGSLATAQLPAIYSLTPVPSPNGITPPNLPQGEEYLMGAGEKKPHPSPNYSLTPNPSPNGEGSENYCLQIKGAFL